MWYQQEQMMSAIILVQAFLSAAAQAMPMSAAAQAMPMSAAAQAMPMILSKSEHYLIKDLTKRSVSSQIDLLVSSQIDLLVSSQIDLLVSSQIDLSQHFRNIHYQRISAAGKNSNNIGSVQRHIAKTQPAVRSIMKKNNRRRRSISLMGLDNVDSAATALENLRCRHRRCEERRRGSDNNIDLMLQLIKTG